MISIDSFICSSLKKVNDLDNYFWQGSVTRNLICSLKIMKQASYTTYICTYVRTYVHLEHWIHLSSRMFALLSCDFSIPKLKNAKCAHRKCVLITNSYVFIIRYIVNVYWTYLIKSQTTIYKRPHIYTFLGTMQIIRLNALREVINNIFF